MSLSINPTQSNTHYRDRQDSATSIYSIGSRSPSSPPASLPRYMYRVQRSGSQARLCTTDLGIKSRNQTTIINGQGVINRFAGAHLRGDTNISSPFLSVYDDMDQAKALALEWARKYDEETLIYKIDTWEGMGRGPPFRAEHVLSGDAVELARPVREGDVSTGVMHRGEYLFQYWIPAKAIVGDPLLVGGPGPVGARGLGAVGEQCYGRSIWGSGYGVGL